MGETTPSPTRSSNNNSSQPGSSHVSFRWTGDSGCRGASAPLSELSSLSSPSGGDDAMRTRPTSPDWASQLANVTRVHFTYQDEATRTRICKNAQALVDGLQRDRESTTVNAQVARKALRYRKLMDRFSELNPDDTSVDISAFLGIEWHRVVAQGSSDTSETSESSQSSRTDDSDGAEKSESPTHAMVDL